MPLIRKTAQPDAAASFERPPFIDCPRKQYAAGHNDWMSLDDNNLDICPQCYQSCLAPTYYGRFFHKKERAANTRVQCDFNDTWFRLAFVCLFTRKLSDPSMLSTVLLVKGKNGETCPTVLNTQNIREHKTSIQLWYAVRGTKKQMLEDWTVCSECVNKLAHIMPIQGVFELVSPTACLASCDYDIHNPRCQIYVDRMLEEPENNFQALRQFMEIVVTLPECPRTSATNDICHQADNVTICQLCWHWLDPGPFNARFSEVQTQFTCQVYSQRMRQIYATASSNDDWDMLVSKVAQRKDKEGLAAQIQLCKSRVQMLDNQAKIFQRSAIMQSQAASMGNLFRHNAVMDTSGIGWAQATNATAEAQKALLQLQQLQNEWTLYE